MAISREARIWTLLVIDSLFLVVELVVGYAVGSLALVADAFHMLNDVMSLVVALYAIKLSTNSPSSQYSYGWHRAEILAALINGVFLLALCLSIFLEAIERFFSTPEISNPKLVVIVGSLGLASNILGLFLFHDHGHSHEHSHDTPLLSKRTSNHIIGIDASPEDLLEFESTPTETTPLIPSTSVPIRRSESPTSLYGHPAQTRAHVLQAAEQAGYYQAESPRRSSPFSSGSHGRSLSREPVQSPQVASPLGGAPPSNGALYSDIVKHGSDIHTDRPAHTAIDLDESTPTHEHLHSHENGDGHDHEHKPSSGGGHGHSHGSMNMHALLLHVLGDALGNVGVIAAGLIIWLTTWPGKYYSDPIISLVITVIIFTSALPLVKSASFILLQGVPTHISLDALRSDISAVNGVESLHELHVWQLSETKVVASVHVWVANAGEAEFMKLAAAIREVLHSHGVHSCTIQPEFGPQPRMIEVDGSLGTPPDTECLIPCAPGEQCPPDAGCCPPTRAASVSSH